MLLLPWKYPLYEDNIDVINILGARRSIPYDASGFPIRFPIGNAHIISIIDIIPPTRANNVLDIFNVLTASSCFSSAVSSATTFAIAGWVPRLVIAYANKNTS